ncbi:hypothetical protein Tco_1026098, partial [Tanacetum coccineum]
CVDLTGVSPLVGLSSRGFTAGEAALKAASCKVTKHEKTCIENQHVFIPFAFDTFCFLAPEAVELLSRVQQPNPPQRRRDNDDQTMNLLSRTMPRAQPILPMIIRREKGEGIFTPKTNKSPNANGNVTLEKDVKRRRRSDAEAEFAKLLGGLHVKSSMAELSKTDRGDEVDGVKFSELFMDVILESYNNEWCYTSDTRPNPISDPKSPVGTTSDQTKGTKRNQSDLEDFYVDLWMKCERESILDVLLL